MSRLATLAVASIVLNPQKLREVDTESVKFLELVESIKQVGVQQTISVREVVEDGETFYQLIDGLHRLTAAKHAGLDEIDVKIVDADDQQVLMLQIIGNVQRVETKPAEYSQQLITILLNNPAMSQSELAGKLGKSPSWLADILKLEKITSEKVRELIDNGSICLSNAVALSKLPPEEQLNYVEAAMTMNAAEFVPLAHKRVKELAEAARAARAPKVASFEPMPKVRTLAMLKTAVEDADLAAVHTAEVSDVNEAFLLGIKYAISLTPSDIAAQQEEWNKREAAKKQAAADRKAKREAALKQKAEAAQNEANAAAGN